jgi:hypothetical protein
MNYIQPGADGEVVAAGTLVFRVGKNAQLSPAAVADGKVSPEMFELSSKDKDLPIPRLSIWVEELTIADQAWAFLGCKPTYTVVACLNVDDIHQIHSPAGFMALRVDWEQSKTNDENGNEVPNRNPGAVGHCGIANLNQGADNKTDKHKRKALRSMLADIARLSPVPVPHNIPHEHIKIAAFYIAEKACWKGRPEEHWLKGIRQIRRELVRQDQIWRTAQVVAKPG